MEENAQIGNLILTKFVNEEIMTKSEFELRIDSIMDRHEARIDRQFAKIDARYNWIIGLVVTVGLTLGGMMLKVMSMIPHA